MLRINIDSISNDLGTYYYQGEVFTGIAFTINGCDIESALQITSGKAVGLYSNEYFSNQHNLIKIHSDCLEPEEDGEIEPLCYEDDRFTGIAYDFDGEFCTSELYIVRGWVESQVGYYKSGDLSVVELIEDDFSQKYQWYEDGKIHEFNVFERNSFDVNFTFNEQGEISVLSIDGDYFGRFSEIENDLKYTKFSNQDYFVDLLGAEYLYISGPNVDLEVIKKLITNDGLRRTKRLRINRTSIPAEVLKELVSMENLEELNVESDIISVQDLQWFKSQKPTCLVEYNRSEVVF